MEWWQQRSDREKWLIRVGVSFAVIIVLVFIVIQPVIQWNENAHNRAITAERSHALVRQAASLPLRSNNANSEQNDVPIRAILSDTATKAGLTLNSYNPLPDGSTKTSISEANPEALFNWIENLERTHGIIVVFADIAREANQPKFVRANLTFSRE